MEKKKKKKSELEVRDNDPSNPLVWSLPTTLKTMVCMKIDSWIQILCNFLSELYGRIPREIDTIGRLYCKVHAASKI